MPNTQLVQPRGAEPAVRSQRAAFFAAAGLLVAGELSSGLLLAAVQTKSGLALLDGGVHDALVAGRSPSPPRSWPQSAPSPPRPG